MDQRARQSNFKENLSNMTLFVSSKRFQGAEEYYKSEAGNLRRKCEGVKGSPELTGKTRLASGDRRDDREGVE